MTKHRRIVGLMTIALALLAAAATASTTRSPPSSYLTTSDVNSGADAGLHEPRLAAITSYVDATLPGKTLASCSFDSPAQYPP
jgi:hypothetical protein